MKIASSVLECIASVVTPSQSTSISEFQKKAPLSLQISMVGVSPSSVAYCRSTPPCIPSVTREQPGHQVRWRNAVGPGAWHLPTARLASSPPPVM